MLTVPLRCLQSIFDNINFTGLTAHLHESVPAQNYNAQSLEDFDPTPFGQAALQHDQGFPEEELPPPRKQGPARRAKSAAAKHTPVDLDGSDYVPHTKRKRPSGDWSARYARSHPLQLDLSRSPRGRLTAITSLPSTLQSSRTSTR